MYRLLCLVSLKTYQLEEITGEYFERKRIQHADIGDGTTEFPLTEGYDFEHDKKVGKNTA